jgi:hypothetical protein
MFYYQLANTFPTGSYVPSESPIVIHTTYAPDLRGTKFRLPALEMTSSSSDEDYPPLRFISIFVMVSDNSFLILLFDCKNMFIRITKKFFNFIFAAKRGGGPASRQGRGPASRGGAAAES